jgi:hypothetical protein
MPSPIPTTLDRVLDRVAARLSDWLDWPEERTLVMDPEVFTHHPQGDQYLLVWSDAENPDLGVYQGAGRLDTRMQARFSVTVRTRYGVDEATSSRKWLLDQARGHLAARHGAWDALVAFQPIEVDGDGNETGNWLCYEPIAPANATRPRKARIKEMAGWGESALWFVAPYVLNLDQSYQ